MDVDIPFLLRNSYFYLQCFTKTQNTPSWQVILNLVLPYRSAIPAMKTR